MEANERGRGRWGVGDLVPYDQSMQDRDGLDDGAVWWCEHCSTLLLAICIAYGSFRGMGRGKVLFYAIQAMTTFLFISCP